MVPREGFEPSIVGVEIRCLIQLGYGGILVASSGFEPLTSRFQSAYSGHAELHPEKEQPVITGYKMLFRMRGAAGHPAPLELHFALVWETWTKALPLIPSFADSYLQLS